MKICSKCKNEYSEEHKFCKDCGKKLKDKEKIISGKKSLIWLWGTFGIILFLGLIFIFVIPMPYSTTESYTERVPYEAQEPYRESEPYVSESCDDVDFDYEVSEGKPIWNYLENGKGRLEQDLYLKNNEDEEGCWLITVYLYMNDVLIDDNLGNPSEKCVPPHTTRTLVSGYPNGYEEPVDYDNRLNLKLIILGAPSKKSCESATNYKEVTKYRTVTKYKEEEKTRTSTKYASLFKQWTSRSD